VKDGKLLRIVHSGTFDFIVSELILGNAVFVGVVAHAHIRLAVSGKPSTLPLGYQVVQMMFTSLFLIEWIIRLLAYGRSFFTCVEKFWHMFDTGVVMFSTVDLILGLVASQSRNNAATGTLLRMFRTLRMVRAIRMVRVLRVFKELRYIILALRRSATLLIWPLVFLTILMYMCTIVISTSVPSDIRGSTGQSRKLLVNNFGSVFKAMKTLFMTASGGMDWSAAVGSLSSGDDTSYLVFVTYIILSKFLLLNLLSGIFVLSVFENCKADDQRMLQEQILNKSSPGGRLRSVFEHVDVTGTGTIHVDSLENLLFDQTVADVLEEMDMDPSVVAGVFKLLDVDDSGYVSIDELMITLFRLQAHNQVVDLPSLLHESRKVGCHLVKATQASEDGISELKQALCQIQTLQRQSHEALCNVRNPGDCKDHQPSMADSANN